MGKIKGILWSALGVLVTSAFLLPLVASATTWNSPYALGAGGTKPTVALDAQGAIHYAWWEPDTKVIKYAYCTGLTKNTCAPVETLPNNGNDSYYPSIAVDPQGRPNVVWESRDGGSYSVYWSRRDNGAWSNEKKISNESYSELPDIAIGPSGVIHVTYQSKQSNTGYVYYVETDDDFLTTNKFELDAATSDRPIGVAAETALQESNAEGAQLSNGLYPRVTADADDLAHVVWNAPSPYGIYYAIQEPTGGFDDKITVSTGNKDQTPDITYSPNGAVGIIWGTYDNFNIAFAEYFNGSPDLKKYDADGGVAQSLWPRIAVDCLGIFHFAFQGKVTADSNWNVYHRTYNASDNKFTKRETIGDTNAQEQTPALATDARGVVVFTDTSNSSTKGATADLGLNCGGAPTNTATPTSTDVSQTNTATPTNTDVSQTNTPTGTPTETPTVTETPVNSPTPTSTTTDTPTDLPPASQTATLTLTPESSTEHVPATDPRIQYGGTWAEIKNKNASDLWYKRCGGAKKCKADWSAQLDFVGGLRVEWETVYANTYGRADVYLDGKLFERVDLCKLRKNSAVPKFAARTYLLTGGPDTSHNIRIVALGSHSNCSDYDSSFVGVDGFNILR
jgi:hypothetical protein